MTLTELARRLEISIAYLSRIERERENPPPDHLISAMAGALGLPPDDLFAAARRLPPDLRAHTDHVIAVYQPFGEMAAAEPSLCAIAKELRHAPSQIRAWLDEGARVGLEAMLVPPRRPRFPPDAPADIAAITSWLAGVYRPSFGFHLWTVDNLTAAVHRNFGVRLSPAGTRSVIAAEHARRRPEFFERLEWRRRRKRPYLLR